MASFGRKPTSVDHIERRRTKAAPAIEATLESIGARFLQYIRPQQWQVLCSELPSYCDGGRRLRGSQ